MEKNFEQKYQRKFYDVLLDGENLQEFKSIYERIDEIERCRGVKYPEMVLPIMNKSSKNVNLKIRVKNYSDYNLLIDKWPHDAFKTGVKAYSTPPNLKILILNVKKSLKIKPGFRITDELYHKYGLYNVKRIYNHRNEPCNKLIAKCKTISDYIHVLKNGIKIGKEQNFHAVVPNIVNYKTCQNCGSLNHQAKDCHSKQLCKQP